MNVDSFTKGLQRAALANRKQRQGKQQQIHQQVNIAMLDTELYRTTLSIKL